MWNPLTRDYYSGAGVGKSILYSVIRLRDALVFHDLCMNLRLHYQMYE
jgi:hypothetical protein